MRTRTNRPSRRDVLQLMLGVPVALAGGAAYGLSSGVDSSSFVPIGGLPQWVVMQGADAASPAALFLHGGPAEAQSPFLSQFQPWQKELVIINWDQRGAGRTFGKNGPSTPNVTLPRMTQDTIEVAEYGLRKLGKRKLVLIGHSWGAILGLAAVTQRPGLFHAFVGTGQPVTWSLSLEAREGWAKEQARAAGDVYALKALEAASSLGITDFKRLNASQKYRWAPDDVEYLKVQEAFVGKPPFPTQGPVADWIAGGDFSGPKLWETVTSFDARKSAAELGVPLIVIQGKEDHTVSSPAARAWLGTVRAPCKVYVEIPGGHFACFTHGADFIAAVRTHVLPLVNSGRCMPADVSRGRSE
jgi:proline iminopeptidase